MSTTHDFDNGDEVLFQFDPFDSHQSLLVPSLTFGMSAFDEEVAVEPPEGVNSKAITKGKARTMPMLIGQPSIVHDLFEMSSQSLSSPMSYDSSSSAMMCSPSTSYLSSDSDSHLRHHCSFLIEETGDVEPLKFVSDSHTGKGKEKAQFPMLPPLTFPNIDFDCDQSIPLTPGPSSCGRGSTINDFPPSSTTAISSLLPIHSSEVGISLSNAPLTRCQSLTNSPSECLSTGSPLFETPGAPSNLSRQLLEIFDQRGNNNVSGSLVIDPSSLDLQVIPSEFDNQPPAWYTTAKTLDGTICSHSREVCRQKNRSRSSPYPISALDIIPDVSTDIFQALPIVIPNYYNLILPRELQLHILRALVDLHEDDHRRSILERRFTLAKATSSRGRWVGRDKGIRELLKLSRVCL